MPTNTPNFGFQAFIPGDYYSASVDKARFASIDQHMHFLSSAVGDGIIEGWEISHIAGLNISISSGMGLIDNFVTRTFGKEQRSLLDNNEVYVWVKRRPGVIGQAGAFSNVAELNYSDSTPPDSPTGLSVGSQTVSSISLSWDDMSLSSFDLTAYLIYRSIDGSSFVLIDEISATEYVDLDLEDDTTYYYRVSSIDGSGNESLFASISASTILDTTPPGDPLSVRSVSADEAIHLIWRPSQIGDLANYKIEYTPVNSLNIPVGSLNSFTISASSLFASINDLSNGQRYLITIKSVGDNGVESEGIDVYETPQSYLGPRDVTDLQISERQGDGFLSNNILQVNWTPAIDPYRPAVAHEILIEEVDSQTGDFITSIWIREAADNQREFALFPVEENGSITNRRVTSRTEYFITVRAIDANGNSSVGKTGRYTTVSYQPPQRVTAIQSEQLLDQSIRFSWSNSSSQFRDNVISLRRTDLNFIDPDLIIEDESPIGSANSYTVDPSLVQPESSFILEVKVVDEFGNESATTQIIFDVTSLDEIAKPRVPSQVIAVANDSQSTISWNRSSTPYVTGYRIYRAQQQITYESSDFTRVETVDSSTFVYTDYNVDNGQTYAYFVTAIDIYGRESLNPVDDDYFDYNLVLVTPKVSGQLGVISDLTATIDIAGTGVDLTWVPTAGDFDGYEIFRSIDNTYSFELIGTADVSASSFNDSNSLKSTSDYYYIVRKFKNEADIFITEQNTTIANAVYLGKIETSLGNVVIDRSEVRIIKDMKGPIQEATRELLSLHTHEKFSDTDDRRIGLSNNLRVSEWVTTDYRVYTTITDIEETGNFEVYLNRELAEKFNIGFTINKAQGRLVFDRILSEPSSDIANGDYPFDEPPEIVVVFEGVPETDGILPAERVFELSANQIQSGVFRKDQIPQLNHDGRLNETLKPITAPAIAIDDGYRFAMNIDLAKSDGTGAPHEYPSSVTWYEVFQAFLNDGEEILLGSTSNGLYTSLDGGASWRKRVDFQTPPREFFYSAERNYYFALTNKGVFGSTGGTFRGFGKWFNIRGMENAKIARGITETPDGDVFCTSDLGVFKLVEDVGRDSYFWEQTPIFGPESTESFDIIYDHVRNRTIVSNELGIFQTTNAGVRWDFSDDMPDQRPIFQFAFHGDVLFALTQFRVWRLRPGQPFFEEVASFDDVKVSRKMIIWRDRLFITTDKGLLVSDRMSNIDNDTVIAFELAFAELNVNNYTMPATCMNLIEDSMYVGTDEKLFLAKNPGKLSLTWEGSARFVPTFYVNGEEQKIGIRYNTSKNLGESLVSFDEKQPVRAKVEVATQYQYFLAENGGWADSNFAAGVQVSVNGSPINDWSVCERPATALQEFELPGYNDRNSNKAGADYYRDLFELNKSILINESDDGAISLKNFNVENVNIMLAFLDRFLSNLTPNILLPEGYRNENLIGNIDGFNTEGDVFSFPAFVVLLLSSSDSYKRFGLTPFGTYLNNNIDDLNLSGPRSVADSQGGVGEDGTGGADRDGSGGGSGSGSTGSGSLGSRGFGGV